MTLTKKDIVEHLQNELGLPKNQTIKIVESLLELIKSALDSGEDLLVSGFGKFCVKSKKQRSCRNLATGEHMMLKSRNIVTFRCSGKLRDAYCLQSCEL
jgi:integration host factor subunit alpha